jgi:hypothetical protein
MLALLGLSPLVAVVVSRLWSVPAMFTSPTVAVAVES